MEIRLENIKYKNILKDISMVFNEGNIYSIIGSNGSGKSVLLDCIVGNKGVTGGKIFGVENIKIGFVSQNIDDTFFCDTLIKEFELTLEENDYSKEKINKRIMDSIKMIGLPEYFLERDPVTLSSSEKRLAALARAISFNPEVLILDEPTIGMSKSEKNTLIQIIRKIKRRFNKTIILATQDMDFVNEISDYVYAMENGTIIAEGDKYTVFKNTDLLLKSGISKPSIIRFEDYVLKNKNVKLGYRDDINDLVKDILRNIK